MKRKAKVIMTCEAIVFIHESINGDQVIEEVDEVTEIEDFEVKSFIY